MSCLFFEEQKQEGFKGGVSARNDYVEKKLETTGKFSGKRIESSKFYEHTSVFTIRRVTSNFKYPS